MGVVLFVIILEHFQQLLFVFKTVVGNVVEGFPFDFLDLVEEELFLLNHFQVLPLLNLNVFTEGVDFLSNLVDHLI